MMNAMDMAQEIIRLSALCEAKDDQLSETQQKLKESEAECLEQARLNGMGSEREARLIAENAELTRKLAEQHKSALQKYNECEGDSETDPLERLRFFCSCSMRNRDWIDVERFFNDVSQLLEEAKRQAAPKDTARIDWIEQQLFGHRWDGVVGSGSRTYWTIQPGWRHVVKNMEGVSFREAIDKAMLAAAPQP